MIIRIQTQHNYKLEQSQEQSILTDQEEINHLYQDINKRYIICIVIQNIL